MLNVSEFYCAECFSIVIRCLFSCSFRVLWIQFVLALFILVYREPEVTACQTSPCGINAVCKERNNAGSCSCLPEYYGDPYIECRPECVMNSDCPKTKSCFNQKCVDPCIGVCSSNAECFVVNHSPLCTCLSGYTGNPSVGCYEIPRRTLHFSHKNISHLVLGGFWIIFFLISIRTNKTNRSIMSTITLWTI